MNLPNPKQEELKWGCKVDYVQRMLNEIDYKSKMDHYRFVDLVCEHYDKIFLGQNK